MLLNAISNIFYYNTARICIDCFEVNDLVFNIFHLSSTLKLKY